MIHSILTTECASDGYDYDGRTFGVTLLGVRVCVFFGRRHRWGTVQQELDRADQITDAAARLGQLHREQP